MLSVPPFTVSDCPFCIIWSLCYPSLHLQLLIAPLVSFGHCVICPSIYSFWLPLWYLLVIVLSVPTFTASDCPFGIFWSLCYLSLHLQLLIAPLVSFGHCVICPSIYSFWLPLWYLLTIVLSVPPFTASDCLFGIFWSLCYLSLHLQLLIAPLISFGHCIICPSIYSFWLPLWYLLVIVLSVPPFTASDCPFEIAWSLCYLFLHLQLLIAPLVSFGHCVICPSIYRFWLPLWYLLVILLFVPPFTSSDCPFDIFWSLCYLSLHLQLLIAPLVYFGHCVIRPSIYTFWLPLWYILVIVLSVLPFTASDCPFGIFWSLCYPSLHYSFWLPLWYLLVIVLSVSPFTASDCPFGIFWSLCYLSLHLQLLIAPLKLLGHCVICPSIYSFWLLLWYLLVIVLSVPPFTGSDCPFGIFWSFCYLSLHLHLLIAPLRSFDHCVICPSIYSFWLPLWYILVIVLSVLPFTPSDCPFDIFWSLCYLSFHLQLLIAPLVSFGHCVTRPSITASDCPFDILWSLCYPSLHLQLLIAPLVSFSHCVICPSIYSFWLPLWYLLVIVLSVPPFTASDCPFGIFWSLWCLSLHLHLLITPSISFGHCVICPSIYNFWLPLYYLLIIVLSVPPFTASDCPFGIFWSLCYLSLHLQLLIAPLISFGHCVICPYIYSFWLPLWYLLVIVLSVPPFTASDCPFGIFWSLCYLSLHLQLLIAPLVSFDHCVIRPSFYSFWLPLWYLLVIVLSVPPFTASDCPFDIFWSLYYLSLHLQLLIAPLVSFGHCVICPSIYSFWLPLWNCLVIVLSVPPFTASDCSFGIFWSLCYLSLHLQVLIAPLVSFGHFVICPSIYIFWLPLWYLLIIVLSVPPFTASDCPFGIFWSLCYPSFHLHLLIAPLIYFGHCVICPSIYSFWLPLWYLLVIVLPVPPLQLLIAPLISFGHCVIRLSIYSFWLPLWYLLVIVLSIPPFTASDCPFEIAWSLCYLSLHLQLLIAPLVSFGHCVICPSIYRFWLPLWYLLVILLFVPPFTSSDCPFEIFWSLCYLSLHLQLLIAPLVYFGHCVIRPSIYTFWLPLWYILVIVLSVLPFTASDCPFGIFWSLCYPSLHYSFWLPLWYLVVIVLSVSPFTASDCPFDIFWSLWYLSLHLQLLIAPLISFDHCVICPSIYSFWLPLWYLLIIVLSVPPFTASDYPLISFGHCVICPSIYSFWLPLWYILVIVLSVPPFTASDCPFDIFWSLCYLSLHLQLLIAPLISFGHCVICPSIYNFWLPLWYLLIIVLSVPPFTASDCPFDIFWSLCYLSLHLQLLIAPLISFGHCVICPSIYSFWLPLLYHLVIVLSVPSFTASDCPFGIFWSLCYLSLHLQLLIAPLISFGHCVICPYIYSFWLPLWYLLVIVLSVPPFTASDCPFGIFWSLCYLSLHLQLLIAPLVSFDHCVIRPSFFSFWLPLWYLLVIVLSVPPFTASDCPFDIFWSLYYLSLHLQLLIATLKCLVIMLSVPPFTSSDCPFDIFCSLCYLSLHLQLLIAPLISFDHCVICPSIYSFWLPLWYLLVIVLSVPPFTVSDCPFEIAWSLCYLSLHLQLLIAPLVSFGHCVICPSIYRFWLPLWYLLVILLFVPPFTSSDCPFDIFWSLCYLSLHLQLLIAPLVYFGHCVIRPSIYTFWLPLWYILVIVLSVLPFTASDCPFGIFWSLCYPSLHYSFWLPLWYLLVIVLSVSPFQASDCPFGIFWSLCYLSLHLQLLIALWYLLVIVLSVPPFTASDCPFGIFWSLCCLSLHLQLVIAPSISFGHCVICPSIYNFWLPLYYLLIIVLSVPPFTASDCPFDIFWSLWYLSLHLQLLIAPLISFDHCVICPSIYSFWLPLWYLLIIVLSVPPFTASDCPLISFGHCVICPSIYSLWLPLWYVLVIVLSVPPFTASDCPFGIFWSLCYLSLHLQLLIAPLVSFDHCVIRPSFYSFWLPLWYLLVIVLSVPPFTASDCPFDIFWSLYYLSLHLQLLIAPLVSFGHCVICPSISASDCPFEIAWSLCYLSLHLQLLIAPLVSFGHCVICPSIYRFWLPLWYLLVILLFVPPFTSSDCPFDIFWSLCYLSLHLQLLIAPLVYFGHCVIRPSIYTFWLPLWYILVIVLSVLPFTASDCPFGIFWSLCYPSLHYSFWLPLWYLLVIVLSVSPFTASDCPFGIFWSLCYLSLHLQLLIALWYLLVIVLSVPPFTASDCPFGIFWSLCCLSLHLQLLIAPSISFGHCVICPSIYNFWLPLYYLLIIVLSVPPFTASDCPFDIFWSLWYLSLHLQLLIAPLISFDHCVICPSIYSFWLPLWYLLIIVLSVPPFTASDCPLISFGHCVICPSIYSFWLPLWYLLVIVLSVPPFTASDCPFDIFWSLCYLSLHLQLLIAPLISFGHCVICPSIYNFWLPLWYLLIIVLSVPPFTASDCPFDIFWSLCYLSLHLELLIAPSISFDHCFICPSIYSFWLPLWYLLIIVLSVPPFTASDCPFGIFWSLCYLSLHLQLLIAPLISFGHCVICPSIYSFWLPLWYLLIIVLSVHPFTASECHFGIFWSLCYLSLHLQLLIAPLISFGHCVICPSIYSFWLALWYLLIIVISVLPFTASNCPFGIFWSLCYPSLHLQLLIAPLISFAHCVICSSIYIFWLPLWYLLVIVLSVPPFTASDCPFDIFWSLCYPFFHLQLLIAPLVSFGHCVICPSIYSFWLPLWYLLVIVLSVPPFTASYCHFDIFWSLCYPSLHLQLLIAPLVSFDHCVICPSIYNFRLPLWYLLVIVLSVPPFTTSDCPFDIFWSLCYLSLHLQFLIAPLLSFDHCVICPSIYSFWLPLWYLLIIVVSVPPFTASDCPFDIFWSLCYLSLHLQLLIAPLISFDHCVICPSIYSFWLPFDIVWSLCYLSLHLELLIAPLISFDHCFICPSIYSFWLPLWYLLIIVLSVPPFTASDCPFGIFWSLCYLSLHLQLLIAPLISFGHCVICPSIYSFWLPLWYLLIIVLSVHPFTASECHFGIFWSLCYLSLHLQLLIAPLISFGHCVICPSIYSFWLAFWYLLIIVISVLPFTASNCPFGIFWSLCYPSLHLQLLIAPLISFAHCVICSSIYIFWLPLWYLLVIVLFVPPFTASDCPFDIFWSLCYPFFHLQLLIAPLVSFGHCVICPSIYSFWLPLWYLLVIVLSVPPFTASYCHFDIFWSLCYPSLHLQLLIAPLVSFDHCVICPSIYNFRLPLWYLLVIVLSVPPFTASYCHFDIFWSLCYPSLHLQLLIAPLVSFDHCVICPSIYNFRLPLWYLLVIVLSVPPFTTSDCPFDIFWSLCYLSLHLQFLIAPLLSFDHCVICPSIYSFWLPLWYLLIIVVSVPPFTASDCPFDIFWSLCYLSLHLQLLIAPLISFDHCVICPSIYSFWLPFDIVWSLCYLSLHLELLIAPLISFDHCFICPSIYSFWLPLWYLLIIVLSVPPFTASDCPFGIFWSLCYLSLHLQLLIAPLISFGHCVICPSIYSFWLPLWYLLIIVLSVHPFTASECHFGIFWSLCYLSLHLQLLIAPLISFGHCVICPSIYSFWLALWYLLIIVISVLPFTASNCPFGIFWSLCYLSLHLQLLIAPLISFAHCVICSSIYIFWLPLWYLLVIVLFVSIYSFWLPLWYLLVIMLSVFPFTASDCPFGILWSLCYLSLHLQFLIAPLISFGHCVICPSIYSFLLPLWYLLVIVLSVPPFTASDCPFGIFWSLCYLSLHLQLPIAPLISFGHCVICPSIYNFWLPLRYLLVIVLSVPPFTISDCPFTIFWSLCYLSLHLQLLIAPLISFDHCGICPSIYSFWLPLWYLLIIVLSVPLFTASDCPFDIFWSLCYLSLHLQLLIALWYRLVIVLSVPAFTASDCPFDIFWSLCYPSLHLQLLIAPLISFDHCVICPSIYNFWLPLWYLLVIVLSVPPFTTSDCPFDIFWSLCYLSLHLQLLIAPLISFDHCVICPYI